MDNFDLSRVIADVVSLERTKNFEQNIEIFLIKVNKSANEIYKQESSDETKSFLFNSLKAELQQSRFKNREVIVYDAVNSKKNTHELVSVSDFPNITQMLNKLNDENEYLPSTKGMNEGKFRLYMITLNIGEHKYKVFGSFSNVLELKKKYLIGHFITLGNLTNSKIEFKEENNIIGFSKKVEILIVDDKYVLINQAESKFESLFKMNQLFSSQATAILNENEKIKQVFSEETRQRLIDKVSSGKRMASRLIKIVSDEERFNKTIENISKIELIISNPTHKFYSKVKDVKYENGKLFVENGLEVQLLDAISDAFYQAVISETENVDESRM